MESHTPYQYPDQTLQVLLYRTLLHVDLDILYMRLYRSVRACMTLPEGGCQVDVHTYTCPKHHILSQTQVPRTWLCCDGVSSSQLQFSKPADCEIVSVMVIVDKLSCSSSSSVTITWGVKGDRGTEATHE